MEKACVLMLDRDFLGSSSREVVSGAAHPWCAIERPDTYNLRRSGNQRVSRTAKQCFRVASSLTVCRCLLWPQMNKKVSTPRYGSGYQLPVPSSSREVGELRPCPAYPAGAIG